MPTQAELEMVQLAVEKTLRPLLDPLIRKIEALELTISTSDKPELMTAGDIRKEKGLARSLVDKMVKEGKLTPVYFHPTRYYRKEVEKMIGSKTLKVSK